MRSIFLIMISALMFFCMCGKKDAQSSKVGDGNSAANARFVSPADGLNLRDKPDTAGNKIVTIPSGESVSLIEETGSDVTIGSSTGKWSKVTWKDKTGWAFGGFLSKTKLSDPSVSQLKTLEGDYDEDAPAEPGNPSNWLSIHNSIISYGLGGMMEASWYCLVTKVSVTGQVYTLTGDRSRKPEAGEVQWTTPSAENKESIGITVFSPTKIMVGSSMFTKR